MSVLKLLEISCHCVFHVALRYRYLDGATGEALQETFLTINVIHQKWPPQPYNAGEFVVGDQVSLTVPFELYPAPESSYLTWKVTDKSNQITELKPGTLFTVQ